MRPPRKDSAILARLATGERQADVARELDVSQGTVSRARKRAMGRKRPGAQAAGSLKRIAVAAALAEAYARARAEVAHRFAVRVSFVEGVSRDLRP